MSKSEIRGKHDAGATKLRRESLPASHSYKRDPPGRANGGATQYAYMERVQGPHVSVPKEDAPGGVPPRVGRTWMASRPGASRGGVAANVKPGAVGLFTGIECSRVRDSSWMYLTSLVNYPNRRRTSRGTKKTTRSYCSRTPTVLG